MKKIVLTVLALVLALALCAGVAEEKSGEYTVFNSTGENITELYLYKADSADKGANLAENFKKNKQVITYTGDEKDVLILEFVTESGRTGVFSTLHVEVAPINLLAADAMTGATPISFFKPQGTGEYTIYNATGEELSGLYLYKADSEDKGTNYAEGFADGAVLTFTGDTDSVLVLEFTTAGGYTGAFTTLHVEVAPITLLAADAMTGATPITFSAPAN